MKMFQDVPIIYRQEEHFICPQESQWEERYYQRLVSHDQTNLSDEQIKHVCINYLEGLEWVFLYYTSGCPHWRWKYNYAYPPLLKSLTQYVPKLQTKFISSLKPSNSNWNVPFKPYTQLLYVLPPILHSRFIPDSILQKVYKLHHTCFLPHKSDNDILEWKFQWAFCRYFWESHIESPEISMEIMESWDNISKTKTKTKSKTIVS